MAPTTDQNEPSLVWLATHRPLAILSRMPDTSVMFAAGAIAGAIGKTATAPLDRLKIIIQVQGKMVHGTPSTLSSTTIYYMDDFPSGMTGVWRSYNYATAARISFSAAAECTSTTVTPIWSFTSQGHYIYHIPGTRRYQWAEQPTLNPRRHMLWQPMPAALVVAVTVVRVSTKGN